MLDKILDDYVGRVAAENQPMFRSDIDYDGLEARRLDIINEWRSLGREEQQKFANQAAFESSRGIPDLRSPDLQPAKNLSLIRKEVGARLGSHETLRSLAIDALDFGDSLLELVESIENVNEIKEVYKIRKLASGKGKDSGLNSAEAAKIKNCLTQGRELYLSGRNGSLMVKPLNFFYALTAYSYGIIILNNPLRYRKDMLPGSHGMAYLPADIRAQFGGDAARGTFSDLVTAFPTHLIKHGHIEFHIDCTESLLSFYQTRFDVGLGTLMSMVPEMSAYYKLITGKNSRCFPLEIVRASESRSVVWEFHIGDGEKRPEVSGVDQAFYGLARSERHGKLIITVPASNLSNIRACVYSDLRNSLWYVENPFFPVILPEVAVHFLSSSLFSNIMRYRPDEWGSVLLNEVPSSVSLMTRHYLSSFQKKLLLLVLRSISKYMPYAASE